MITMDKGVRFVILLGVVSLFSDMTYEAARSINGPFLAILGASSMAVGFTAGFGEFIGYTLRLLFGYLSDKTGRYWSLTIIGYAINLLAVPLIALAGNWEMAACLIIAERFGKAIRTPARDAMLSHASSNIGRGWAFGLHEALDQIGAILGPLIVTAVLAWKGSYRYGFAALALPAITALTVLLIARKIYPHPERMESQAPSEKNIKLAASFWFFLCATAFIAMGFADFPLIAYHMKSSGFMKDTWIPLLYAVTMGVDALSALIAGRLYDKKGLLFLVGMVALTAWSVPLVFLSGPIPAILGMVLWGISMGTQESVIRAVIADLSPKDKRGTVFGIFNASFGGAWFIGSTLMGYLYGHSPFWMAAFSVIMQLSSIPFIVMAKNKTKAQA